MKNEYLKLIEEHDKVLATLREFWLSAKLPAERSKHRNHIDACLDERLRLMRCRDAAI